MEMDAIAAAARLALLGTSAELAVPFEELKPEIRDRWRGVVAVVQGTSFTCQECAARHEAMMKPQPDVQCAGCVKWEAYGVKMEDNARVLAKRIDAVRAVLEGRAAGIV